MLQNANLFGITNPETCLCFVEGYGAGHSQLQIVIKHAGAVEIVHSVVFQAVEYFEGPLSWEGANFSIGKSEECIRLLRLSSRHKSLTDTQLAAKFRLFFVWLSHFQSKEQGIKIVAARGDLLPTNVPLINR